MEAKNGKRKVSRSLGFLKGGTFVELSDRVIEACIQAFEENDNEKRGKALNNIAVLVSSKAKVIQAKFVKKLLDLLNASDSDEVDLIHDELKEFLRTTVAKRVFDSFENHPLFSQKEQVGSENYLSDAFTMELR